MIARKLVFFPPPTNYEFDFLPDLDDAKDSHVNLELGSVGTSRLNQTMWLLDADGNRILPVKNANFTAHMIPTRNNELIAAFFVKQDRFVFYSVLIEGRAQFTILFSHGNATDIGYMRDGMLDLSRTLNVNVLVYDYCGYGLSSGVPAIGNVLADVEAAYDFLVRVKRIDPRTIIVYGQSLGSGPTCHVAQKKEVGGVIIHAGIQSGLRVIRREMKETRFFDIFPNIDIIPTITAPIFIIHGTHDTEIPVDHGVNNYEASKKLFEPWFVDGAGHNDIEVSFRPEYMSRLNRFLKFLQAQRDKM